MKNLIENWSELFFQSFGAFGEKFMGTIPNIIGALLVLFIGWIIARFLSSAIGKLLKSIGFDNLAKRFRVVEMLERGNIDKTPSFIIQRFIYWVLLLIVLITSSDILGWKAVSEEISKLISYLPTLFSAIVLFILGAFIAGFVRDVIKSTTASLGISTGRIISQFIFYLLFIIVSLTSLKQAGIDTSIITSNLLIIIGSVLGAAAISYGFASRTILSNVLASFFGRRTYHIGMIIEIDNIKGKIVGINSISMMLKVNENEILVIPTHDIITKTIKIHQPETSN